MKLIRLYRFFSFLFFCVILKLFKIIIILFSSPDYQVAQGADDLDDTADDSESTKHPSLFPQFSTTPTELKQFPDSAPTVGDKPTKDPKHYLSPSVDKAKKDPPKDSSPSDKGLPNNHKKYQFNIS